MEKIMFIKSNTVTTNIYDNMYDLNKVFADMIAKLDKINIPYGKIVSVTPNTRAKKRWGQCIKTPDGTYEININITLLYKGNDVRGLENTVIHEILHTCPNCMNHGPEWKKWARVVYDAYGYNIQRCSNAYEKGISGAEKPEEPERKKYERRVYNSRYIAEYIDNMSDNWNILIYKKDFICIDTNGRYCVMVFHYVGKGYTVRNCRKMTDSLMNKILCAETWR